MPVTQIFIIRGIRPLRLLLLYPALPVAHDRQHFIRDFLRRPRTGLVQIGVRPNSFGYPIRTIVLTSS